MSSSWNTFYWLVRRELYVFNKRWYSTLIDMTIPTIGSTIVWGYTMPMLGLPANYGGFWILALIILYGTSQPLNDFSKNLLFDVHGDRTIDYELTLPLSPALVHGRIVVSQFIEIVLFSLPALFIGKLLLGHRFDWSHASWPKFILIYTLVMLGTSCAALCAYRLKTVKDLQRFWRRFGRELIFLGANSFPWYALQKSVPPLAYVMLLNPYTYANEGLRAAVLGQNGFISYWACLGVISAFTVFFYVSGFRAFCKRLDCI